MDGSDERESWDGVKEWMEQAEMDKQDRENR